MDMKRTNIIKAMKILLAFIFSACINMFAGNDTYKVLYVSDGDTIAVKKLENNRETGNLIKVRLFGIDAPELKQDHGYESKEFLIGLIRGKNVRIEGEKKDRYGRLLGTVYYKNENINEKMVMTGNAWWYESYDKNNLKMKEYQENAQKKKLGIFSKKGYIPPWEFRKKKK